MSNSIQEANFSEFAAYLPVSVQGKLDNYLSTYELNRHRVYAFAFWMTDNEISAEELLGNTFRRAFAMTDSPTPEAVDRALINEVREFTTIGTLSLACDTCEEIASVRGNMKRVHLERAVVQLPATERLIYLMHDGEGYDHARIAKMLGITEDESRIGVHQARLRIRELVSNMKW